MKNKIDETNAERMKNMKKKTLESKKEKTQRKPYNDIYNGRLLCRHLQ